MGRWIWTRRPPDWAATDPLSYTLDHSNGPTTPLLPEITLILSLHGTAWARGLISRVGRYFGWTYGPLTHYLSSMPLGTARRGREV